MLAAAQGAPNWSSVAANGTIIIGALFGFYRFATGSLKSMISEQVLPLFQQHTKTDEAQTAATNKVLQKLQKAIKQHEKRDDAQFRAVHSSLEEIKNGVNAQTKEKA